MEKLLVECCLELGAAGLVKGIQDLGAAGISCATAELAAGGGSGMAIRLDAVPLRAGAELGFCARCAAAKENAVGWLHRAIIHRDVTASDISRG